VRVEIDANLQPILCDHDGLIRVLDNLIDNAIKFNRSGGWIAVGASAREGEVEFRVSDSGAGIGAEQHSRLFDRFWQAKTDRRGAGLGLSIAKGIVEALGGQIWVDSRVGQGSTFRFTVPVAQAVPAVASMAAAPSDGSL
jgi:signal transduction histidine kinase